jgi:cytochrome oxidase assembly protein ShyY1
MVDREFSFLRTPRWIAGILIALVAVVLFVNLGLWQLRRLDERSALNTTISNRMTATPEDLHDVLAQFGSDPETLEYRRVAVSGTYQLTDEAILQSRSQGGRSGHNALTPLVTTTGEVLVVDRGWVPIDVQGPPIVGAEPAAVDVTLTGILRRSETYGPLGDVPESGPLTRIGRIDLPALASGWGSEVLPVYLALETQDPAQQGDLPAPLLLPEPGEGPHFSYAVQWFLFATVVAIGFPILVFRTASRRDAPSSSGTDGVID